MKFFNCLLKLRGVNIDIIKSKKNKPIFRLTKEEK